MLISCQTQRLLSYYIVRSLRDWATLFSGCETAYLNLHDVSRTAAIQN